MKWIVEKVKYHVHHHFTKVHLDRTPEQLERERWLIPNIIPFSRWFLMPAAVMIQACLGTLYAWSGFNLPVEAKLFGLNGAIDRAIAVNVFYVACAMLPVSSSIMGPWLERNGPMKGALLGGCLFYLGHLISALAMYVEQLWLLYIGYGVFFGAGIGLAYISPVSPLQKWFPDMRGLAGGLAVCGYGAGSIIAPYAQKALIGKDYAKTGEKNLGIELTFVILGSCYFVMITVSALVLRMPPPGYEIKGVNIHTIKVAEKKKGANKEDGEENDVDLSAHFAMTLPQSILSKQYAMILFGLLVLSKIQSIVQNQFAKSADEAATINSVLGGLNLLGRALVPIVSDLLKTRRILFVASLACQAVLIGCLPTIMTIQNYTGAIFCFATITFFYGGGFGLIPAFLADQFGAKNVGATHGLILTAWAIDSVALGFVFSAVYNQQKHAMPDSPLQWYNLDFYWVLGPVLASFLMSLFIPCNLRDTRLPKVAGETLRFRLLNLPMVRFVSGKLQVLTKENEDKEWDQYINQLQAEKSTVPLRDSTKLTFATVFDDAKKPDDLELQPEAVQSEVNSKIDK